MLLELGGTLLQQGRLLDAVERPKRLGLDSVLGDDLLVNVALGGAGDIKDVLDVDDLVVHLLEDCGRRQGHVAPLALLEPRVRQELVDREPLLGVDREAVPYQVLGCKRKRG